MTEFLESGELEILTILGEAFPKKLHLHQLAPNAALSSDTPELLLNLDSLLTRQLIIGMPLRGSEGLVDVASILISDKGRDLLKERQSSSRAEATVSTLMPVQAKILNVLIASPSDVSAERDVVVSAINEWNASHHVRTGIMLHPVRWETHSYPATGQHLQNVLNKQIVDSGHLLIGIFGSRIGTPTGDAQSGTIAEIEQFRKSGRYVGLYFSDGGVSQEAEREQLEALEAYRRSLQHDTLYFTFKSAEDLRRLVTQHLPKIVAEVEVSLEQIGTRAHSAKPPRPPRTVRLVSRSASDLLEGDDFSPKEIELLWTAAKSSDGLLLHSLTFDGEGLRADGKHFLDGANARTAAEWIGALRGLEVRGLIEPLSEERDFFQVTGEGYAAADQMEEFTIWSAQVVVLRAYYMNAPSQEISLTCKRIIAVPTRYYPDQVGADGWVSRSIKEPKTLIVEGIAPLPKVDWQPTDVEFIDVTSGQVETFRIDGMTFVRPSSLKLPLAD
jgi:hypothetical protein